MATDPIDTPSDATSTALVVANERATIALARMVGSMKMLRKEVAVRADWRTHARRHPWSWLLGAFVIGFLVGFSRPARAPALPAPRR